MNLRWGWCYANPKRISYKWDENQAQTKRETPLTLKHRYHGDRKIFWDHWDWWHVCKCAQPVQRIFPLLLSLALLLYLTELVRSWRVKKCYEDVIFESTVVIELENVTTFFYPVWDVIEVVLGPLSKWAQDDMRTFGGNKVIENIPQMVESAVESLTHSLAQHVPFDAATLRA